MRRTWGLRTWVTFALAIGTAASAQGLRPVSSTTLTRIRQEEAQRALQATQELRSLRAPLHLSNFDDFAVKRTSTDRFGETHVRVQQTYRGVPVWGGAALVHYGADGQRLGTTDALVRGIDLSTTAKLTAGQAVDAATKVLSPKGSWSVQPTSELTVYPLRQAVLPANQDPRKVNAAEVRSVLTGYALAYHVHTELANDADGVQQTDLLIDANSGKVLSRWSSLETAAAIGSGNSQYSGTVSLNTNDLGNGTFELRDLTRALQPHPLTGDVGITIRDMANGSSGWGTVVTDADNAWGDGANYVLTNGSTSANGQTAAVDAAYGLAQTWDYYQTYHQRAGIDGNGTAAVGRVHYKKNYDNAFWSDSCFCMTFGDGNPSYGYSEFTAIDVVGHELSHGVTARTAGLIYSGESGGLNEANSDIHGTMVEFYARSGGNIDATPAPAGANWLIGEQITGDPSMPLRWMYKPSLDGVSPDAWYPGIGDLDVHYSSGPMNRAFYFLSQGASSDSTADTYSPYLPGGMSGIGNSEAAAIWYRALTSYLLPWSNYLDARVAALHAAKDYFGTLSPEYAAVENAFAAINVGYSAGTFDDLYPPSVTVTAAESGSRLTFTADPVDNVGTVFVDFYVDGHYVDTVQSAPFVLNLHSYDFTSGNHQVMAFASDAAGNYGYDVQPFTLVNGYTESLQNGNFELGNNGAWSWTDTVWNSPFIFADTSAHGGSYLAWLNENGQAGTDTLWQQVTLPSTPAILDYWLAVDSNEADGLRHGTFTVTVDDGSGAGPVQLGNTVDNLNTALGNYHEYKLDLSAYSGKTVTLTFTGNETAPSASGKATGFRLDDVSVRSFANPDTDAPVVTVSEVGTTGTISLGADVSDQSLISQVQFYVDGAAFGAPLAAAPYTLNLTAASFANGPHQLSATATDSAGNTGNASAVTFYIDNTRQQLLQNPGFETGTVDSSGNWIADAWFQSSDAGAPIIFDDGAVSYSGNGYAWMGYYAGGGTPMKDVISQGVTFPAGTQNAKLTFYWGAWSAETDGTVHDTFHLQIRDQSGATVLKELDTKTNLDADGYWHQLSYDVTEFKGQTVTLYMEEDNDGANATNVVMDDFELDVSQSDPPPTVSAWESGDGGPIALGGTVSTDGLLRVTSVSFVIDGNAVSTIANPSSRFGISYDSTLLGDGVHTLIVQATDSSGQTSVSAPVTFSINNWMAGDQSPPQISLAWSDHYCASSNLVVTATDDFVVEEVELYFDGQFIGSFPGAKSPFQLDVPTSQLSPGPHTLLANAIDARGHHATATIGFVSNDLVINPPFSLVLAGASQAFTGESCSLQPSTVSWAVQESGGGSIDANGTYLAPTTQGTYHVVATADADPSHTNSATVRVYSPDLDADGTTDGVDMGQLAAAYGSKTGDSNYSAAADLDGNGAVDDADLNLFLPQFGK